MSDKVNGNNPGSIFVQFGVLEIKILKVNKRRRTPSDGKNSLHFGKLKT
jgi:hypothetical protein